MAVKRNWHTANILEASTDLKKTNVVISDILFLLFLSLTVVWCLKTLWARRRLYYYSWNVPGPISFPIVGSTLHFLLNPDDILGAERKMANKYPGIFRLWLGPKLFYAITESKYLEILLTNQNSLGKADDYRLTEPLVRKGLFTAPGKPAHLPKDEPDCVPSHGIFTIKYAKREIRIIAVIFIFILLLGDFVLPKDSAAMLCIFHIHVNPKYWPDPYKFGPDRFLPEEVTKRPLCTYLPFSYGARNYIGMKYALMSTKAIFATVLRKYKFFTDYKSIEDIGLKVNIVLRTTYGYKVTFQPRE